MGRDSPLLASPQGGVAERSKNIAKHPLIAKSGWFSDRNKRKTTPTASVSVASRNFLMTQSPLLAVMQGGDYRAPFQFVHTFFMPAFKFKPKIILEFERGRKARAYSRSGRITCRSDCSP